MTPRDNHKLTTGERQATIHELLAERMQLAIRETFVTLMEEEVEEFIQAAYYQRTAERRDYRNGYYERNLVTGMGEIEDMPVPRTRSGYRTQLFEHYQRRQAELDDSICKMFVQPPHRTAVPPALVGGYNEQVTGPQPAQRKEVRVWKIEKLDLIGDC